MSDVLASTMRLLGYHGDRYTCYIGPVLAEWLSNKLPSATEEMPDFRLLDTGSGRILILIGTERISTRSKHDLAGRVVSEPVLGPAYEWRLA